jgi:hypothetical protein
VAESPLPDGFGDLAAFASVWALPTELERNRQRHRATIEDIQRFYDAMLARMDAIMEHLNRYRLDDLPAAERRLLDLALSLAEVAPAIEFYRQPSVIDGYESQRFVPRSGQ